MRRIALLLWALLAFAPLANASPISWGNNPQSPPPLAQPICGGGSTTVAENSGFTSLNLGLSGGAATSAAVTSGPSNGSTSISGAAISYEPSSNYVGADGLTFTATNATGTCSPAGTASITVTFTPVVHTYATSGSGTETVPAGASTCVITIWGGGGGGSSAGGGGAGYRTFSIGVTGGNTLAYVVGANGAGGLAGTNQPTSGTASTVTATVSGGSVSMTANGGGGALYTPTVGAGGASSGSGSGATGSNGVLPSGGVGGDGGNAGGPGGGAGGIGVDNMSLPSVSIGSPPGGGGGGNTGASSFGGPGAVGTVSFSYT